MALPIILAFMARMGLKHGGAKAIQMAIKKYGKKAVVKATNKMTYIGKNVAKKPIKKIKLPKGLVKAKKTKGTNPYTLADWKQGIKYPAKMFKKKP
jgi:N-methylhydantoinase B/oxoprolinase/acetone carboxylase alpha subunit|tara:strand:- start:132 stop:419 length:288 start_codon:yes stop_codon:yes gene_type:complete